MVRGGTAGARMAALWVAAWAFTGCTEIQRAEQDYTDARIDEAIARYHVEAAKVHVGDLQDKVLALLEPTQAGLYSNEIKPPEAFPTETEGGDRSMIQVFFFRSSRHADELATDRDGLPPADDFTPYLFTDGVLTARGWTALLSLRMRKPSHQAAPSDKKAACPEYGPLAGCF